MRTLETARPPVEWRRPTLGGTLCSLALFACGLGALALLGCLGLMAMGLAMPPERLGAHAVISYANLLLMGASVLYLAHSWLPVRALGPWATGLAGAGLAAMVAGLLVRATESAQLPPAGRVVLTSLSDVVSLFSAATVLIYLMMERTYRSRSAGAFVMPIVAAAVLFNAWLMAGGHAARVHSIPLLGGCLMCAHVLAGLLAYSCFAVAAGLGVMVLRRRGGQGARAPRVPLHPARIERLMHRAILLGLLLFTVSLGFGAATAGTSWSRCWEWDWGAKETATLPVWANYAAYAAMYWWRRWRGARMAWWTIVAFGLTLLSFAVVRLCFPGIHSST